MTLKQAKFASTYLETGNATEAAMAAYKPKKRATARSIGSENLTKPNIRAYLDEKAKDATAMIYKLSQVAKSEHVRLNASRDILDRAGYFVDKTNIAETSEKLPMPILGNLYDVSVLTPEVERKKAIEEDREKIKEILQSLRAEKNI